MCPLPYLLKDEETNNLMMEIDRRLVNLEGKIGEGLSHTDLKDIEDHKTFLKQDGSVPVIGTLDFSKSGQIKNSRNKILNVDIFNGAVRVSQIKNQLEVDVSTIDHGLLLGLGDDDHPQYALLLGRSGGQTLIGGTGSGDNLLFQSTSNGTTGLIAFTSLTQGLIWNEDKKALSLGGSAFDMTVGGTTKDHIFTTHSTGGANAYDITFHRHSATSGPFLAGARSRGSEPSPSVVQDGDNLLDIFGVGFDGTDYEFAASIMFDVDGTPGDGDMPGKIRFLTTPDGSGTLIDRMAIGQDGIVSILNRLSLSQVAGSITDGNIWNDSTQKALQTFVSGIEQTLTGCIFTQTADQTIANTTTETTLFGTGVGTITLPANFWVVGKTIRLEIHGDFADTGNPTAEIQVYYGATSLIDSGAITLSGLSGIEEWECEVIITCRSTGATGTLETVIDWEYETTTGSSAIERLDVSGTLTVVDTTAAGALDVTYQWGTANASNTLTSEVALVQVLN